MNYEHLDQIVASYRDELIANIQKWVSVPSVQGEAAGENAPFGAEVRRMLDMALEDARSFGFEVRDIDGYAGDVRFGAGRETMGMLAHLDVVPAGDGWRHAPWGGEVDGGKIYGRGTTDDKGPALCALYAMRAVKEAGIPMKDGVRLILGCDEETGMSDMRHYAEKMDMPDYGFSPDAEFPVINIEKGGMNVLISKVTGGEAGASIPVYSLYAGERPNVVPAEAKAVIGLGAMRLQDLADRLADIEAAHADFHLSCDEIPGNRAEIVATGVNAHGAMPHLGVNAAGMLLIALKELNAGSSTAAGGGSKEAIAMLADVIGMETTGEKLGIACADELSGALTCNLGILRYEADCPRPPSDAADPRDGSARPRIRPASNELSAHLDCRYPICGDEGKMLGSAVKAVAPAGMSVRLIGSHAPLHVPAEHKIVKGLLKVYHEVTGLPAYTIAIGGGTYSRMMPNTVAFGVCFPGDMDLCHVADEYIDIEKMMLGVKIFAHAIVELAGAKAE